MIFIAFAYGLMLGPWLLCAAVVAYVWLRGP